MKTKMHELADLKQSIWLDYISRTLIEQGELQDLIDKGLLGMTSNPSIFEKAVTSSNDYDAKIKELKNSGKTTFEIYDELTVKDVQDAADIFKPVYDNSKTLDGYVSLEVNPKLSMDAKGTLKEAKRLHEKVNRPNLMLKIPATDPGFEAIEEMVAVGANINITLIFSLDQYVKTAQAYIRGLKRFAECGGDLSKVRSVASVFVSRIDSAVDKKLDEIVNEEDLDDNVKVMGQGLKGMAAVSNSMIIYSKYLEIFSSDDFKALQAKGANIQRVLWGSTGTKDPSYSDIKYVTELIGEDTVNTIPGNTLDAFLDHGEAAVVLPGDVESAKKVIIDLKTLGIDVDAVNADLLEKGLDAFVKAFDSLLKSIEEKAI